MEGRKDAEHFKTLDQPTKKKHTYFILGIALLFTIIRLYLYSKAIYGTDMSATYDDQLLIRYAQNILDGKWLGEYTTTTLSKGISYSLFLVLAHKLHLSYAVLFGMFSIFASILVALAFKPIVKNKYLLLSFYFYFCFLRLVLHMNIPLERIVMPS